MRDTVFERNFHGKKEQLHMHANVERNLGFWRRIAISFLTWLAGSFFELQLVRRFNEDSKGKKFSKREGQIELANKATMTALENLFVNQDLVESYSKGRPSYPPSLFQMLASLTGQHERAWDVGTGNGQAAFGIAEHYKSVVATDVSEPQLSLAKKSHNITYAKMSATPPAEELERIVGPEGSIDLVTVATAIHWFDLDKFYPIVKHVLRKRGGVVAIWNYERKTFQLSPEFDAAFERWIETVRPYRATDRVSFNEMPFPFDPVPGIEAGKGVDGNPIAIKTEKRTSFDEFIHMCRSFSPTQVALEQGFDALNEEAKEALSKAWGPERVRTLNYIIYVLLGSVPAASAN